MSAEFADTNVLIYLLSGDALKADKAESCLRRRPVISVQVLNELANVARRKLAMSPDETWLFLDSVRALATVVPVTIDVHDLGLALAKHHGFSIYDSMIIAAASLAGCQTVLSEDMQHGFKTETGVTIINPFR